MPVSVTSHKWNHQDTPTCWCCTYLCVCAVFSVALVADKHVRLGSSDLRQLMFSDGFFGQSLSDLLQLCTCHLLHPNTKKFPPHQAGHSLKEITVISSCKTRCPTSALMLAMRRGEMFPHRTFRRRSGFFWSFRLEMRLRRRDLYFISVDLNSWKICGCDKQSRI